MTSRDTDRLLFLQAARRELLRLRKLFYRVFVSEITQTVREAGDLDPLVGIQRGLRMTRESYPSRASIQRELDHAYPAVAEAIMYNGGDGYLYNGRWNPPLGPGL